MVVMNGAWKIRPANPKPSSATPTVSDPVDAHLMPRTKYSDCALRAAPEARHEHKPNGGCRRLTGPKSHPRHMDVVFHLALWFAQPLPATQAVVHGVVFARDGTRVADGRLELSCGDWTQMSTTGVDGSFRITDAPAVDCTLTVACTRRSR